MRESIFYKILWPFIWLFVHIFIRPKYKGLENIPKDGSVILAGNHISILDPLVLISSTKRNIHFLAKNELWKGPKRIIFSNLGLIPVNRRTKDAFALKKAEEYLKKSMVIGIFPEGTTEKGRGVMPFKIGAVKMAYDTNTQIVPFAIIGKYGLFKRIKIVFLKPIVVNNDLEKENNYLRDLIIKSIKEG